MRGFSFFAAATALYSAVPAAAMSLSGAAADAGTTEGCRNMPGDPGWPDAAAWNQLNTTVGGRLLVGTPLAQVCHGPAYNASACSSLRDRYTQPATYFQDPVNVMSPYWLNDTCSPYTAPDAACGQGNLAVYAINVSSAVDVAAGLAFARAHNIRLIIKNTGHDFIGRSSGAGSLALWMHNLKDISFVDDYTSAPYRGPAARAGAGVQFFELYAAAAAQGLRVVGGFCPTVGIAGGYVQGAGHGPLGGTYGLAADNALEFEVVTADGRHLVASPAQHADLYWALSGGGGGTYAVVLALTTRAHPDGRVAGGSFAFANEDADAYYAAIAAWQEHLVLDRIPGCTTVWGFTHASFNVAFVTLAGGDAAAVAAALAPYFAKLQALGVQVRDVETSDRPTFYEHIEHYTGAPPYGPL